ncbi:MAG: YihY/virulence factor BrkB family protein, partial [Janthinobacterium lividum]
MATRSKLDHPVLIGLLGIAGFFLPGPTAPASRAVAQESSKPRQQAAEGSSQGRNATRPAEIPPAGWWAILKRVVAQVSTDRVMTEAAGVTFFSLLAMFPAMTALVSLYGLFADPHTVSDHLAAMDGLLPGGGLDIIKEQVKSLTSGEPKELGFGVLFGFAASLWSANQGIKSLFDALNIVNDEKETRGFLHRTVLTLSFTLGALVFIVLALVAVVAIPAILAFVGLGSVLDFILRFARWPVLLAAIGLFLALIYRFGPSREAAKWRWISWGSAFAAVAWVIGSAGFSWYVSNFGSYNKTYGSLG